jgi:hypothetical protein
MRKDIIPFIVAIILIAFILVVFLAAETYAAEPFTLSLRGPDTITIRDGERTVTYRIDITNKTAEYLWLDLESEELELSGGVFLCPFETATVETLLTVSPADEGEFLLAVEAKRTRAELPVTVVVREEREIEKPEWPLFMWSQRFYELLERHGFDRALELWRAEYGEW